MHDISVLYYVFFSFYTQLACLFHGSFRTVLDEIVVFDDFCTDKSFFKVRMDHSGALGSFPALFVCLTPYFLYTGREIGFQIQ